MQAVAERETKTTKPAVKRSGKRFATFAALALFAALNIGLAQFSHVYQPPIEKVVTEAGAETNGHTKPWSWWLARKYLQQDKAPDVVLFGSSQMGSAVCAADAQHLYRTIDALTHRRGARLESDLQTAVKHPVSVFNLASPGAMCSDAYMASEALFKDNLKPKLVVLGVSPRDFIDNTMPYPATTEPFKFYSQYISAGKLTTVSYLDPMSWLQFGVDSVPFHKLGTFIQSQATNNGEEHPQQKKATTALAAIMGGGIAVPGAWRVPADIPAMWVDNTREYKKRFENPHPPIYGAERKFFEEFLTKMHQRGVQVLVVGMPSLPMNRALLSDQFWTEFRGMLATDCAKNGAQFLDLTGNPDFVKADYLDTVHLNAYGGMKLFHKIADAVASNHLIK